MEIWRNNRKQTTDAERDVAHNGGTAGGEVDGGIAHTFDGLEDVRDGLDAVIARHSLHQEGHLVSIIC